MNFADPFKQLVERKLWPIALLLVAALVAVPFLLAKPAEDSPLPPSTASLAEGPGASESIVNVGEPATREDVRAVLGARKDPFRPAQLHRVEQPKDTLTDPGVETAVGGGDAGGGPDAGTGGGVTTDPVTPVDVTPAPVATEVPTVEPPVDPKPTYDVYSLQVRFGDPSGDLTTENVERLTGLPGDEQEPVALYLGLSENRQSAVFLIDAGTEVVGDGRCDPSPANCQTLVLEPGETVFLTRDDEQYQLDLIKIVTRKTTDAAEARKSRVAVAKGGRRALKRFHGAGGYRYSKSTGTLRKLDSAPARRGLKSSGSKLLLSSSG